MYSGIASIPAEYGMYTAIVPNIVYSLFGTDKYVSYGPFPLMCLLISEALYSAGFTVRAQT